MNSDRKDFAGGDLRPHTLGEMQHGFLRESSLVDEDDDDDDDDGDAGAHPECDVDLDSLCAANVLLLLEPGSTLSTFQTALNFAFLWVRCTFHYPPRKTIRKEPADREILRDQSPPCGPRCAMSSPCQSKRTTAPWPQDAVSFQFPTCHILGKQLAHQFCIC